MARSNRSTKAEKSKQAAAPASDEQMVAALRRERDAVARSGKDNKPRLAAIDKQLSAYGAGGKKADAPAGGSDPGGSDPGDGGAPQGRHQPDQNDA